MYLLAAEAYHFNDENDKAQNILEKGMKVANDIGDKETISEIRDFERHIQYNGWFGRFEESIGGFVEDFISDFDDYDDNDLEEEDY